LPRRDTNSSSSFLRLSLSLLDSRSSRWRSVLRILISPRLKDVLTERGPPGEVVRKPPRGRMADRLSGLGTMTRARTRYDMARVIARRVRIKNNLTDGGANSGLEFGNPSCRASM